MMNTHDIAHRDTPAAADIRAVEAADLRKSLSRLQCQTEGGWGASSQRLKERAGVLHRYLDGSSVRITAKSFYAHLIDLANAPARQGRKPSVTSFQRKKRQPTPAELDGLKRGNAQRHKEKLARLARKRGKESRA
jgi:hypothetical protein